MRERLMQRDRGEGHGQTSLQHHAPLHGVEQLGDVGMAWVVPALNCKLDSLEQHPYTHLCIHNTNDTAVQRIVRVSCTLDERLAEKEGELLIAVVCQACESVRTILLDAVRTSPQTCEFILSIAARCHSQSLCLVVDGLTGATDTVDVDWFTVWSWWAWMVKSPQPMMQCRSMSAMSDLHTPAQCSQSVVQSTRVRACVSSLQDHIEEVEQSSERMARRYIREKGGGD